jgi:hypothetical protein
VFGPEREKIREKKEMVRDQLLLSKEGAMLWSSGPVFMGMEREIK